MYRNLAEKKQWRPSRYRHRYVKHAARTGSALLFALLTASASRAWGATVEIRCTRLSDMAKGELEARARLFLTSADMESASIAVECDATNAWLVWIDGSKTTIDPRTNMVEGTLDAIEDRIARAKRAAPPAGSSTGEPGADEAGAAPKRNDAPADEVSL